MPDNSIKSSIKEKTSPFIQGEEKRNNSYYDFIRVIYVLDIIYIILLQP